MPVIVFIVFQLNDKVISRVFPLFKVFHTTIRTLEDSINTPTCMTEKICSKLYCFVLQRLLRQKPDGSAQFWSPLTLCTCSSGHVEVVCMDTKTRHAFQQMVQGVQKCQNFFKSVKRYVLGLPSLLSQNYMYPTEFTTKVLLSMQNQITVSIVNNRNYSGISVT